MRQDGIWLGGQPDEELGSWRQRCWSWLCHYCSTFSDPWTWLRRRCCPTPHDPLAEPEEETNETQDQMVDLQFCRQDMWTRMCQYLLRCDPDPPDQIARRVLLESFHVLRLYLRQYNDEDVSNLKAEVTASDRYDMWADLIVKLDSTTTLFIIVALVIIGLVTERLQDLVDSSPAISGFYNSVQLFITLAFAAEVIVRILAYMLQQHRPICSSDNVTGLKEFLYNPYHILDLALVVSSSTAIHCYLLYS